MRALFSFLLFAFSVQFTVAQTAGTPVAPKQWHSYWIAAQGDNGTSYGVFYFRKSIELAAKPGSFIVHVSADNRYKLFVNGKLVSLGPGAGRYLLLEL
jgi:alpha-L-rhamnosidase